MVCVISALHWIEKNASENLAAMAENYPRPCPEQSLYPIILAAHAKVRAGRIKWTASIVSPWTQQ